MPKQKLQWITDELSSLKAQGLFTNIRTLESPQGARITVNGESKLNFCSNNYLGLANDPRLKKAAQDAIERWGVGPGAVRTIAGTMSFHTELEERLAKFKGAEATISFQSGFTANLATIPALVGKGDLIFSDALNHASIIDGCRLSRAKIIPYKHNDVDDLRRVVAENSPFNKALLVTDGVFSMDGDIAPLDKLVEVAEEHGLIFMVDDAHGEGVMGHGGRGIVDHFGLHGRVDVEIGTLSKAFGVVGGYVAGARAIVDWLRQRGRPFLFSSAVTPADVAACLAAVDILENSTELVDKLWENGRYFKAHLQGMGFDIGMSQTPITPVMLGEATVAQKMSQRLFEEGVFATAIGFPTVPRGKARIRVMLSAAHTKTDLDEGLQIFERVGKELNII